MESVMRRSKSRGEAIFGFFELGEEFLNL
jgi:hypothetical protein